MNLQRRKALVLAGCMGAAAALGAALQPASRRADEARPARDLGRIFPERFGSWMTDRAAATLVRAADRNGRQSRFYDQLLERVFVDREGHSVMLSVAYVGEQTSDMQLHRPEVCYRAGGFSIDGRREAVLTVDGKALPVVHLFAELPGRPEPITYWTVLQGQDDASGSAPAWWGRALAAVRRPRLDGMLVRVSSIGADVEAAYRLHAVFADALARALAPADRAWVIDAAVRS